MARSYHHGDLRDAMIEETLNMLENDEMALIGFRELARRLDVSRTAPYRHFESVENLLGVVAEEGFRRFVEALEAVTEDRRYNPQERFLELGVAYINFAVNHSSHYRLMFDPRFFQNEAFPAVRKLASKSFNLLKQTVVAACLQPDSSDAEKIHMANLAWATVHGMSRLFIDGQWDKIQDRPAYIRSSCRRLMVQFSVPPATSL